MSRAKRREVVLWLGENPRPQEWPMRHNAVVAFDPTTFLKRIESGKTTRANIGTSRSSFPTVTPPMPCSSFRAAARSSNGALLTVVLHD
jgi:hypothetical protein